MKYIFLKKEIDNNNVNLNNFIPKIKINDKYLININHLNYNEEEFDIIDYFGGVIQFLPFYHIIKNVNNNENIKLGELLSDFSSFLIIIIAKKILLNKNAFKYFKKYAIFVFYLILNIDLDLNVIFDFDKEKRKEKINKQTKLKSYLEYLKMIYYAQKNAYDFNVKCELTELIIFDDIKNEVEVNIFKKPKKHINQL